jgi:hypothetical protein
LKVLVQWTLGTPGGWETLDLSADPQAWRRVAKRPAPGPGVMGAQDDTPGHVFDLNVQGVCFAGADHYAVEPIAGNGVRVTVWYDDPDDYAPGERYARVWTFRPLAPDARLRGAINTRQSQVIYAEPHAFDPIAWGTPIQGAEWRTWAEFSPPSAAITRHGIWLGAASVMAHLEARSLKAWWSSEWTSHLDNRYLDWEGDLRSQREMGLYLPNTHTITYYQRDTDRAVGYVAVANEDALELTAGAGETETRSVPGPTSSGGGWAFTTDTNQPNSADWPSGNYRAQLDCSVAGADITYEVTDFARVNSTAASVSESVSSGESKVSGTGLKLFTSGTWNPSAGSAGDRFAFVTQEFNANMSMAQNITFVFDSDAYADGPWTSGTTTNQSVDVSVSSTPTVSRQAGKIVAVSVSETSTITRSTNKTISTVSVSATPTLLKQINKTIDTVSVSATVTLDAFRQYLKTLAVDVAATLTFTRQVGKLMELTPSSTSTISRAITTTIPTVSVSSTSTVTKQVGKLISTVEAASTSTLAAATTYLKALAVDVANTPTMIRQVGKVLALEVSQTPTMARVLAFVRTLAVDVSSTSTMLRSIAKALAVNVSSTSTIAAGLSYLRTLSVEVSATVTMTRLMAYVRTLSVDVSSLSTIARQVGKLIALEVSSTSTTTRLMAYLRTLAVDVSSTSTLTQLMAYVRTLSVDVSQTPTMLREIGKTLAVEVAATLTFTRQVAKTIALNVSALIDLATEFMSGGGTTFPQSLDVSVVATVTMLRQTAKTVALEVTSTSTMARVVSFLRTLAVDVSSTSTMLRQTAKTFAVDVASTPLVTTAIIRAQSLAVDVAATANMVRSVGKVLAVEAASTATVTRQIAKTIALSVSAAISLAANESVTIGRGILTLINAAVGGLLSSITGRDALTVTDASRGSTSVSNAARGGVAVSDDSTADLTVTDE